MSRDTVLIVTDVQNDFCPGGALAVERGDEVIPLINHLIASHDHVVLTQDWHPADHLSFASQHPDRRPFETITLPYGPQTLWPDHCVQGTDGANFHLGLHWTKAELVLRKGFRREVDSYSVFFENDHTTPTGLGGYLKERGLKHVVLCGLATDYCVGYSALDARRLGFAATVVEPACRAIDLQGSLGEMKRRWAEAGVSVSGRQAA
jgi:nicotinamidase/pyrazinamidase